jgi:hypothetical protein
VKDLGGGGLERRKTGEDCRRKAGEDEDWRGGRLERTRTGGGRLDKMKM